MKTITMTNPTDISSVEEYTEMFWVPSIEEHRTLSVYRESDNSYAYYYEAGAERHETSFATGQAAYEAGIKAVRETSPDATAPLS